METEPGSHKWENFWFSFEIERLWSLREHYWPAARRNSLFKGQIPKNTHNI